MPDIFDDIDQFALTDKRVAMATLVATHGTSPKKEGAKMWIGEDGRILGSVTIGGCVDARVIAESEKALISRQPVFLSIEMNDEDAWEAGFSCAGRVDVLVEPLDLSDPRDKLPGVFDIVRLELNQGKSVALVTNLEEISQKLLIREDGEMTGSLGDLELESEVGAIAVDLIRRRSSRVVSMRGESAAVDVFFEVHGPPSTLVIFGAGHVSMPLVNLAKEMGFKTIVVDGRPRFATPERFPHVDRLIIGIPSEIAETFIYTSSTFVVLTAHDYKYDIPVLKTVLPSAAGYVGLLGSKRRGRAIVEFLEEGGMSREILNRLHVPTGLDIGAETVAEIALSILAEAIAVRSGRNGAPLQHRT